MRDGETQSGDALMVELLCLTVQRLAYSSIALANKFEDPYTCNRPHRDSQADHVTVNLDVISSDGCLYVAM